MGLSMLHTSKSRAARSVCEGIGGITAIYDCRAASQLTFSARLDSAPPPHPSNLHEGQSESLYPPHHPNEQL